MPLSHEHVGSRILEKIKIYILARAELLFNLCYEIPCSSNPNFKSDIQVHSTRVFKPEFSKIKCRSISRGIIWNCRDLFYVVMNLTSPIPKNPDQVQSCQMNPPLFVGILQNPTVTKKCQVNPVWIICQNL